MTTLAESLLAAGAKGALVTFWCNLATRELGIELSPLERGVDEPIVRGGLTYQLLEDAAHRDVVAELLATLVADFPDLLAPSPPSV